METIDFSKIAKKYREISTAQSSASENLFKLLDIKPDESVLDIGCGTGNLTFKIKSLTKNRVTGIDVSEGMIKEAVKNYKNTGIEFLTKNAQDSSFNEEFDVIFCNSTFQWFNDIELSLKKLYIALKPGGRIGIQAPATDYYCPNFILAIDKITKDERIGKTFSYFQNPWLFFNSSKEYEEIFRKEGFEIVFAKIDSVVSQYSPKLVFEIFSSGAIAGYLNQDYYSTKIDEDYIELFKNGVKEEIDKQKNEEGFINLTFNRIYLIAYRPNAMSNVKRQM